MFPIKQKFHNTAAFLDNSNFWMFGCFFYHCAAGLVWKKVTKWTVGTPIQSKSVIYIAVKASKLLCIIFFWFYTFLLNFCFIGNIRHNFLVPRIIETTPKTFMPIQIPDLHSVSQNFVSFSEYMNFNLTTYAHRQFKQK